MEREREETAGRSTGPMNDLELALIQELEGDRRLGHGVEEHRPGNVLDFIQMSGLTSPQGQTLHVRQGTTAIALPPVDGPLSFFEHGVRDVDRSMDIGAEGRHDPALDGEDAYLGSSRETQDSIIGLKRIIADLEVEERERRHSDLETPRRPSPARPQRPPVSNQSTARQMDPEEFMEEFSVIRLDTQTAISPIDERPEVVPKPKPGAAPRPRASVPTPTPPLVDFEEAQGLMDALEEQEPELSRQVTLPTFDDGATPDAARPSGPRPVTLPMGRQPIRAEKHYDRLSGKPRRNLPYGRWLHRLIVLTIVVGGVAFITRLYLDQASTPLGAYGAAEKLLDGGSYREASLSFQGFARKFPSHALRPDAVFMAGYTLHLTPPEPQGAAQRAYDEAIEILQRFIQDYPGHPKSARAGTLLGLLYYKMDRYTEAISILSDPDRRVEDPGGYLPGLRSLARAYAAVSQMDNARSAFLRAASLPGNIAPEEDYIDLASLYQKLADRSPTEDVRTRYLRAAIEQWDRALLVPGLLRSKKEEIQLLRDATAGRLGSEVQPIARTETTPRPATRVRVPGGAVDRRTTTQ